ncbi:RagB/SusD family nutrient uptake outer membrane protein [Formosa haliotis]|uniref:RagB/SusD family nutrient uptake outer membrane protein n=1 Tax=Formosa haliotis TaxID=1555194 RepID=UPI0008243705|nr:RagB/SusD family nutrient uptake outer membrane protein [Formosa haliotis]
MKKIYITTILSLILCASCSDDFVEIDEVGALDTATIFGSDDYAEQAIIGLYDVMQYNYAKDWDSAFFVKLLPGDDSNAGGGSSTDQAQLQDIDDYSNVSVDNVSIVSNWTLFYRTIAIANTIIANVEVGDLSKKEMYLAEAKFIRAWSYFELTTMWGEVPLRLTNPTELNPSAFAAPKATIAELYAQIESDLTDAIAGLPNKGSTDQNFRVSKGAAQGLMGKVLVFQEKYSESIPFFEAVISNSAYGLEEDPMHVWSVNSEFGKESLLEIGFITTNGYDWGNFPWGGRTESNIHQQLMGPRGDGIFNVAPVGLINGWGFNLPSKKLIDAFEAAGDTQRKAATLMTESELIAGGGSVDQSIADGGKVWDYDGAIRIKYVTRAEDTSADGVRDLNYGTNWRLFRYAEVLLLAAEAYNKVGQDDQALIELNKIRFRAGLDDLSGLSGTALFDAIVDEKYLELAFEGQRFWDLVRWGKAASELSNTGYSSKNNLFPIPLAELELNEALTTADQNPGY